MKSPSRSHRRVVCELAIGFLDCEGSRSWRGNVVCRHCRWILDNNHLGELVCPPHFPRTLALLQVVAANDNGTVDGVSQIWPADLALAACRAQEIRKGKVDREPMRLGP